MTARRRLFRLTPGALLVLLILVGGIILLAVCFSGPENKVGYHITYEGIRSTGLLIRNETVTDLTAYEKVDFENWVEGQKIPASAQVALAYKRGYLKNTLSKLQETERNIVTYQNQTLLPPYDDRTISKMNFDAEVLIKEMSSATSGYIELYSQLCDLLRQRQAYIQANYDVSSNQYMQELYSDEADYLESLRAWRDTYSADTDGFIGFYCDGFEASLQDFSPEDFSSTRLKDLMKQEKSSIKGYKIVRDDAWYMAVTVSSKDELIEGAAYSVYIGSSVDPETGILVKTEKSRQGLMLLFRFDDHVERYLNTRITDVFIGQRYAGMTVPVKALHNNTVTVKEGKAKRIVTVEPLYTDGRYAYFVPTEELKVGQKVIKK